MKKLVFIWAVALLVTNSVWASTGLNERAGRHKPPQEAIDVCKDKSEGAAVEITTARGDTIKAICRQINGQLVAVPEGGFPGPGNGGPPEGKGKQR
jgi:hypothetical protein